MEQKNLPKLKKIEEITWVCRKCKLLRSNKVMHIHGMPLPVDKLKEIENREKSKKTEAVLQGECAVARGEDKATQCV